MCNGALLPISQYDALYALIGTTFGGDGVQTFGLPNLQGRTPVGTGTTPAGRSYGIGQTGGNENVILTVSTMAGHSHGITGGQWPINTEQATTPTPTSGFLAPTDFSIYNNSTTGDTCGPISGSMNPTPAAGGGSQPFSVLNPYQVVNYIIATEGIFPSRS